MSYTPQFVLDFREILQSSISKIVMHRKYHTFADTRGNSKQFKMDQLNTEFSSQQVSDTG